MKVTLGFTFKGYHCEQKNKNLTQKYTIEEKN